MKPSFHDPERSQIMSDRAVRFDLLWRDGQIGDSTYLRSLLIDGMAADDARSRLGQLKEDRR